ncbi:MAG TPA: substrate-binding domain-containing protein [Magnetospirillaceae bacterium]|jgi:D-xylose transport system substrate-binding protein
MKSKWHLSGARAAMAIAFGVTALGLMANAAQAKDKIAVSWNNFQEERWKTDEAAIKGALAKAGFDYISADAGSSATKQLADVENLIAQKPKAIIILAQDSGAIEPAVQKALDEKIPVVGYDRLIENPGAYYLTFDNALVGEMQAQAVMKAQPKGNYAIIKGNSADPNADFLRGGIEKVIGGAVKSGAIKIVCETYTDDWKPDNAQKEMEQCLTKTNNKVDAVISENDGMAGGVVAALTAQGLAGIPVSGQDGDHAALNRVALGTQTVSVWKDARALGKAAGEIAAELAKGTALDKVKGTVKFGNGPKKVQMNATLLKPEAITKANLNVVIDAKWITKDEVCKGVKAGSVKACG